MARKRRITQRRYDTAKNAERYKSMTKNNPMKIGLYMIVMQNANAAVNSLQSMRSRNSGKENP